MIAVGTPTLSQLHVFLTVVEAGSFAAAGRRLDRATSVISYTIAKLEAQLGVTLFDRDATRKPQLTDAGRAVLADARVVSRGIENLRVKVGGLLDEVESEVRLVVDAMLPTGRLVDAVSAFRETFPAVALRLHARASPSVARCVLEGDATIGVVGASETASDAIEHRSIGAVSLVAVTAPTYPLAPLLMPGPCDVRRHTQIVVGGCPRERGGNGFATADSSVWQLADPGARLALLRAGLGWGHMPADMVAADLESGRLVALCVPEATKQPYALFTIHRRHAPPGPAGRWIIERFAAQAGQDLHENFGGI